VGGGVGGVDISDVKFVVMYQNQNVINPCTRHFVHNAMWHVK
jgi:hypothetical protein